MKDIKDFATTITTRKYPKKCNKVSRSFMVQEDLTRFIKEFTPGIIVTFSNTEMDGLLGVFDDATCVAYTNIFVDLKNKLYDASFENEYVMDFRINVLTILDWLRDLHMTKKGMNKEVCYFE